MSALTDAATVCLLADVPFALRGDPGVGKTSLISAAAADLGWHLEVVVLSNREPVDVGGYPILSPEGTLRLAPPAWAVTANAATEGAIILMDELTTGHAATRHVALRIFQERVVGETPLGSHVRLAATYNDGEVCGGFDLEPPTRSRMVHLDVDADVDGFTTGLVRGWDAIRAPRLLADDPPSVAATRAEVAGFIRRRPDLLIERPEPGSTGGYPCPRTWEMCGRLLAWTDQLGSTEEVVDLLISGCVGPGPASELLAWRAELDLPDPAAVLADPAHHPLPTRPDQVLVVAHAIVATATQRSSPDAWLAAWTVLERIADAGCIDVVALVVTSLTGERPPGTPVPAAAHRLADQLR